MSALMKNGNIIVTWKPPALPNGQITTYIILYQLWSEAEPRGEWKIIKINGKTYYACFLFSVTNRLSLILFLNHHCLGKLLGRN